MTDFPIFIVAAVLTALVIAVLLMVVLGFSDRVILFLQLAFFAAAVTAMGCAFTRHSFTEYAVWTIYLTGFALMVHMVHRVMRKPAAERELPQSERPNAEQ